VATTLDIKEIHMDIKANMQRQIARAKKMGNKVSQKMLEERLEQLENPQSAQALFMGAPISNQRDK
jgi:hypothetical protein